VNPAVLGVMIPILAVGGFFGWMIALAASRAYEAKLKAQAQTRAAGAGDRDEVLAAVDDLRRELAELAERVDFTERLLAKQREGDRLAPPPPH
jgi:Tfp pilus assembly protein PilO